MSTSVHGPILLLRCKKCSRKTDHVLISIVYTSERGEIEETCECQECGKTKKIYELANPHVDVPMQHSIRNELKEPQEKDFMEVTIRKKKRGFF